MTGKNLISRTYTKKDASRFKNPISKKLN